MVTFHVNQSTKSQCAAGIRLRINDLTESRWERPYPPVCNESETTIQVQLPRNEEGCLENIF